MTKDQLAGHAKDAATAVPPVGAIAAQIAGLSLSDWLVALTIAYTLVLIVHRIVHWNSPPRGK